MSAHARLGPSAAERWITCPGSVRLSEAVTLTGRDQDTNVYAEEGTLAHALGELKARRAFGQISEEEYSLEYAAWVKDAEAFGLTTEQFDEMAIHTRGWVEFLKERVAVHPGSVIRLERRVYPGVEHCWGTADAVIISPKHIEADDFKYGAGIEVEAKDNMQAKLYSLGALEEADEVLDHVEMVFWGIFQPRMDNVAIDSATPAELRKWRDEVVIPAAELAVQPDAPIVPSPKACKWCPAAGDCRVRMEFNTRQDFSRDPDLLSTSEIAEVLDQTPEIRDWLSAVDKAAMRHAYEEGTPVPGWKVVLSGGQRSIPDQAAAIKRLLKAGFKEEDVSRNSIQTLGHLEKLVGKKALPVVLGPTLKPPQGKPSLVHADDTRPAINRTSEAARDFAEET